MKLECDQQCTIFCTFCSVENGLEWLKQHWQILGIFHSILHHILYYARVTVIKRKYRLKFLMDSLYDWILCFPSRRVIVTKMQHRVNFLVDSLYNITIWRTVANINKCNFRCAHTQAQQSAPEQTSPRFSNFHNEFQCQWSNYTTHSHTQNLLPESIWHIQLLHHLMALFYCQHSN